MYNVLSVCLFSFVTHAQSFDLNASVDPLQNKQLVCREKVQDLLKEWGATKDWRGNLSAKGYLSFTPTRELGVWVSVRVMDGKAELIRYSASENLTVQMQKTECKPTLQIVKQPIEKIKNKNPIFSDENLSALLKQSAKDKTSGLIYVWSPHMNWSVLGAEELQGISKELGLTLTLLMDPTVTDATVKKVSPTRLPASAATRVQSSELFFRGIRNHYPAFIYYSNGQIKGDMRTGYDKPEVLKNILRTYAKL